jgi:hypothetical protein
LSAAAITAYFVIAATTSKSSVKGRESFWKALLDTAGTSGPFQFPAYHDVTLFLVVLATCAVTILYVRQCRLFERLLGNCSLAGAAPSERKDIQLFVTKVNGFLRLLGSKLATTLLGITALMVSVLLVRWLRHAGPLRGMRSPVLHVNGRPLLVTSATVKWWLYPGLDTTMRIAFTLIIAWWLYVAFKYIVLASAILILMERVSRARCLVELDIRNRDGHYGLAPIRSLLGGTLWICLFNVLILSVLLLVWHGPTPAAIALTGLALIVASLAVTLPAYAFRTSISRAKSERLAEITTGLTQLELFMARAAYGARGSAATNDGSPKRQSKSFGGLNEPSQDRETYWKILCDRQIAISKVPVSAFKLRELGSSIVSLLLVPSVLLAVAALIR